MTESFLFITLHDGRRLHMKCCGSLPGLQIFANDYQEAGRGGFGSWGGSDLFSTKKKGWSPSTPSWSASQFIPELKSVLPVVPPEEFIEYSVDQVSQWLANNKSLARIAGNTFRKHEVDGRVLLRMSENNMKELIPLMGPRMKLSEAVGIIRAPATKSKPPLTEESKDDPFLETNISVYETTSSLVATAGALLLEEPLRRVCVVTYVSPAPSGGGPFGGGGGRRDAYRGLPLGTPVSMLELTDVSVRSTTNRSAGFGSGSQSSVQITFRHGGSKYHLSGVSEMHNQFMSVLRAVNDPRLEQSLREQSLDPRVAPGVTVVTSRQGKQRHRVVEWGACRGWNRNTHMIFPPPFRAIVYEVMLVRCRLRGSSLFGIIDMQVMCYIFRLLSFHYPPNVFEGHGYPEQFEESPPPPRPAAAAGGMFGAFGGGGGGGGPPPAPLAAPMGSNRF